MRRPPQELKANWDERWGAEPFRVDAIADEERSPRWKRQEQLVKSRFGGFEGLRVIEVGSGRGTTAALYAQRGANVVLFDVSPIALEQAKALFDGVGLRAEYIQGDAFALPESLMGGFHVAMSFGLCEQFIGDHRKGIVAAHLNLLVDDGFAFISVPNRWSPVYRAWMATMMRTGRWKLGTEIPFTVEELNRLVRESGGNVLSTSYGSFASSVVGHNLSQVLSKLRLPAIWIPAVQIPLLDRLAYDVSVAASR